MNFYILVIWDVISINPVVIFAYFFVTIAIITVHMNPICIAISMLFALIYTRNFKLVIVAPITAIINAMFNHRGATLLFYLPSGNHVTLEALVYGLAAGGMLAGIVAWFSYFNKIMTTDKLIYLFGRVSPTLALILSMTLRFSERFSVQYRRALPIVGRRAALMSSAAMMLENGVETADSMRFRGYGSKRRSSFAIFRFDARDVIALVAIIVFGTVLMMKVPMYMFFPRFNVSITLYYIFFAMFCALPVLLRVWEVLVWKATRN